VREQIGRWAAVEDIDDRCCLLRMSVESLDWPLLALGSLGAEFEVRTPPELTDQLRDWSARFARAAR